jgi:hypothetical protein
VRKKVCKENTLNKMGLVRPLTINDLNLPEKNFAPQNETIYLVMDNAGGQD